jgi:hypothetical protein
MERQDQAWAAAIRAGPKSPLRELADAPLDLTYEETLRRTTMKSEHLLRVVYSFFGLLAGDAALLILTLLNALRTSLLLHGQLKAQCLTAVGSFIPIAIVSVIGWLAVGVPAVLILPSRRILQSSLWLLLLLGALLGPIALFVIFLPLSRGMPTSETFTHTGFLWACASLISTVAFAVHCALVHQCARGDVEKTMFHLSGSGGTDVCKMKPR